MSTGHVKQYLLRMIPNGVGGAGRFAAYFKGDGYSINAFADLLPQVIEASGIKVSVGVAKDLIRLFLKACVEHVAKTGETVNVADLFTVMLAIRKSYLRRKSTVERKNVRIILRLLEEMCPSVSFAMSNVVEGKVLKLQSVTSPDCDPGFVRQGAVATINGLNTTMLDGDTVEAEMKNSSGNVVKVPCSFTSVSSTRLDVVVPSTFGGVEYAGKKITFYVTNRCGETDQGRETEDISATLLAGEESTPEPEPTPTAPTVTAINGGNTFCAGGNTVHGTDMRFADAHPASHIVLKNSEGQAVTGVTITDTEEPVSETQFRVNVLDNEGTLADGADYTWEFAMVDSQGNPVTVTKSARWVSE